MTNLKVKNIGPIVNVNLELKRFNFFIGAQSSGKSTIAKIVSFCAWMEKEVQTHPNHHTDLAQYEKTFRSQLELFHSMHGFFRDDSEIEYKSDFSTICYSNGQCQIKLDGRKTYKRVKVLYIPAERAVAIKNLTQTTENNMKSFSVDFDSARSYYNYGQGLDLGHLGIKYYQTMEEGELRNRIVADGKSYDLRLEDGSSGLQSIVPVFVTVDFYSRVFYSEGVESKTLSVAQERDRKTVRNYLVSKGDSQTVDQRVDRLLETHNTYFVIEEPELSLYPTTQRNLLNFLVANCNGKRKHSLTITTHSPYIINHLNLLIKAFDKKIRVDGASLDFEGLNVFAVQDGTIRDLKVQNKDVRLIDTSRLSEDISEIYEQYERL